MLIDSCRRLSSDCGQRQCCDPRMIDADLLLFEFLIMPRALGGHFGIARSVRLSVPRRSCLGYRHAGSLQLSHRRPPQMCGLRTRPRTDVDPPRFLDRTAIGGAYRLAVPGRYLVVNRERKKIIHHKQVMDVTFKINLCGRLPGRKFPSSGRPCYTNYTILYITQRNQTIKPNQSNILELI